MNRREFLSTSAALAATGSAALSRQPAETPGFATPQAAMKGPREKVLFVSCTYGNTGIDKPDYLAVVDADPGSKTYSQVVRRLSMPTPGDELHHYGWNICSSCHGKPGDRRYLIVPGLKSSRIHIIDAKDPLNLRMHKVIEPAEVKKAGLSAPHTVHCLPTGEVMLSMLGDADGNAACGFLLLDEKFDVKGRWERGEKRPAFNYDFWYQPRHNLMVSTEWAAPNTYLKGFGTHGKDGEKLFGTHINLWDWKERTLTQSVKVDDGRGGIPLEVRLLHDPARPVGFVGVALSSSIWWVGPDGTPGGGWRAKKVVQVDPWGLPEGSISGLISDILVSMDDRFLYFANWLQGDVRQYDITNPLAPRLAGQLYVGGMSSVAGHRPPADRKLSGGPQMLQLSLDGKRLYVTDSLVSVWDNEFYPEIKTKGSRMIQIDCDTDTGGLALNRNFYVDFGKEPDGPSRAHEVRYPGGDCTSDIFS